MYKKIFFFSLFCLLGTLFPATVLAGNEAYPKGYLVKISNFVPTTAETAKSNDKASAKSSDKNKESYGFQIDLLGSGIENVNIKKLNDVDDEVTISQDGNVLFNKRLPSGEWYAAYLRGKAVPELIHVASGKAGAYLSNFEVIGRTENNTLGVLFTKDYFPIDLDSMRNVQLSLEDKTLFLHYLTIIDPSLINPTQTASKYKTGIIWSERAKIFRVLPSLPE